MRFPRLELFLLVPLLLLKLIAMLLHHHHEEEEEEEEKEEDVVVLGVRAANWAYRGVKTVVIFFIILFYEGIWQDAE